jgi:hypothetical protein
MLRNQFANFFTKCYSFVWQIIPFAKEIQLVVLQMEDNCQLRLLDWYKLTNKPMQNSHAIIPTLSTTDIHIQ